MNKPKFVAKIIDKELIKTERMRSSSVQAIFPTIPQININSGISVQELKSQLQRNIMSSAPSSLLFIWSGKRQLEKQQLDISHQQLIIEQLSMLEQAHGQVAKTEAAKFLAPHVAQAIVNKHFHEMEKAKKQFLSDIHAIDTEMDIRDANLYKERGVAAQAQAEAAKVMAEVQMMNAQTKMVDLQSNLLAKVIEEMKLDEISPSQAFVLVKALNPKGNDDIDFHTKDAMLQAELEKMKTENNILKSKAEKEQADADYHKWAKQEEMKTPDV